jgi:hypothetical protein
MMIAHLAPSGLGLRTATSWEGSRARAPSPRPQPAPGVVSDGWLLPAAACTSGSFPWLPIGPLLLCVPCDWLERDVLVNLSQ